MLQEQFMRPGAPASDCEKRGHSRHVEASVAPNVDEYVPGSHAMQAVTLPYHARYDPIGHEKQSPPTSHWQSSNLELPATERDGYGHRVQLLDPKSFLYVLMGHGEHA
jgi:hypothetical protein